MRKSHFDVKRGEANKPTIKPLTITDKRDRMWIAYILEIRTELNAGYFFLGTYMEPSLIKIEFDPRTLTY